MQDKLLGKPKSGCNVTPKDLQSLPCSPCLRYSTSEDGPDRTVYPKGRSAQLRFFRSLIGILRAYEVHNAIKDRLKRSMDIDSYVPPASFKPSMVRAEAKIKQYESRLQEPF